MPSQDEMVYRSDVFGFCKSRKCSGARRIGIYSVYGDGSETVRCSTCGSRTDFVMLPGQSYNIGTRYDKLGGDDD